jgi:DNA-binding transcriptional LysR family regulator
VSQHISKLEELFGRSLILRQGKQFQLTDAGERLYREARDILQSLANLEYQVGMDPAYEGEVRLKSPGSVGLKLYPHLLELQQQHDKLVIDYRFAPNSEVERSVAEGVVDIGLMTRLSTLDGVQCRRIAEEALLLVTPAETIDPSWGQLLELGFIDHPDGAHHAGQLLAANFHEFQHCHQFTKKGFSNQIGLILEPVTLGLGFTVLPAHAVEAFQKPHLIKTHRLSNPVSECLYLGTNRNTYPANRVKTVIEELSKFL